MRFGLQDRRGDYDRPRLHNVRAKRNPAAALDPFANEPTPDGNLVERAADQNPARRYSSYITAASCIVGALGIVTLLGWALQEPSLTKVLPGTRAMQPLTAVGMIVAGISVAPFVNRHRAARAVASLLLISLGLLALIQEFVGVDTGSELFLFKSTVTAQQPPLADPGRMPALVGLLFILIAVAGATIASSSARWRSFAVFSATAGLIISLLSLGGWILFPHDPVSLVDAAVVMPVHTAVALSLIFPAILLASRESSWITLVLERSWTGRTCRLLLTTATVPIPVAWLAQQGYLAHLYGPELRTLILAMGAVLLLAFLAVHSAVLLGREREDRDELFRAVDMSPNFLMNEHQRIIYWSKGCQHLYGWTSEEALGHGYDLICGRPDAHLPASGTWKAELAQKTKDGRAISVWAKCVTYEQRGAATSLLSVSDVTEQRQAQAALLERDGNLLQLQQELLEVSRLNSMGEVAASLAHELNQPLTAAANFLGAAELTLKLRAEDALPSLSTLMRVRDAISRGKREILRSGDIVRRLREFIVHGDADMKGERLSLIVGDAVALGQGTSYREPMQVRYELSPKADCVLADRVPIQQVLVNLIRNATEAMAGQTDPVPTLTISSSVTEAGLAEIAVTDNGPGIPQEIGENLFAAFSTSKPMGLGVGLSISKRIIEGHGGQLRMVPGDGRGASFRFTLAIFDEEGACA